VLEVNDYKLVFVGGGLFRQPADGPRNFTDILLSFVPTVFGRDWFEAEKAKPRVELERERWSQ
jgi:hypothetical protein